MNLAFAVAAPFRLLDQTLEPLQPLSLVVLARGAYELVLVVVVKVFPLSRVELLDAMLFLALRASGQSDIAACATARSAVWTNE